MSATLPGDHLIHKVKAQGDQVRVTGDQAAVPVKDVVPGRVRVEGDKLDRPYLNLLPL